MRESFTFGDVRRRRVFAWIPIRARRKWFWLEWVDLVEDRWRRFDDHSDGCWRLVSVNGVPVD